MVPMVCPTSAARTLVTSCGSQCGTSPPAGGLSSGFWLLGLQMKNEIVFKCIMKLMQSLAVISFSSSVDIFFLEPFKGLSQSISKFIYSLKDLKKFQSSQLLSWLKTSVFLFWNINFEIENRIWFNSHKISLVSLLLCYNDLVKNIVQTPVKHQGVPVEFTIRASGYNSWFDLVIAPLLVHLELTPNQPPVWKPNPLVNFPLNKSCFQSQKLRHELKGNLFSLENLRN